MRANQSEQESCGSQGQEPLPEWLSRGSSYEPSVDRDSFARRNVLALTRALAKLRTEVDPVGQRPWVDRALGVVTPALRLIGTLALVACVSMARNLAFAWLMLAVLLVLCAMRPAHRIAQIVGPAALAALLAFVVNVPAILLGQASAPVRMATKTFVTVGYVASLAQALGSDGMVAALRGLGLSPHIATVVDLALRDIVLLGEAATSLSEALSLRSVGTNKDKTSSAAGVMGVVFVRAQRLATARAEAMELRGYGLDWTGGRTRYRLRVADAAYVLALAAVIASFAYLEGAMV